MLIDVTGNPENYSNKLQTEVATVSTTCCQQSVIRHLLVVWRSVKLPQLFARTNKSKKILLFALESLIISNSIRNFVGLSVYD